MDQAEARGKIIEAELYVLRAMCQGAPERTVWDDGMLILGSYPFQDSVHQMVFDVLREINSDIPRIIREQLPRRVTNRGFPAVPLEAYFEPHNLNAGQAVALMHAVRATARGEERPDSTVR